MLDEKKKKKIQQFLNDEDMSEAVHRILVYQFLKAPKNRDVQFLAASWLAKDLFDEAWKELSRFQFQDEKEEKIESNIGV